jgi:hypothetical protein
LSAFAERLENLARECKIVIMAERHRATAGDRRFGTGAIAMAGMFSSGCGLVWDIPDRSLDENVDCSQGPCACIPGFGNCDGEDANGCETDLSSGSEHCGACGHDCQGGDCIAGKCQPIELVAGTSAALLEIDATHAYWATASTATYQDGVMVFDPPQTTVSRVPRSGGEVQVLASLTDGRVPVGLRVHGTDCYWVEVGPYWNTPSTIQVRPVDGSLPARALATYPTRIDTLAVNEEHVFFTVLDSTAYLGDSRYSVGRVPLAGGAVEILATEIAANKMTSLLLDEQRAYWIELGLSAHGRVVTVPLGGGETTVFSDAHALSMARDETNLYWLGGSEVSQDANAVWKKPLRGGQPFPLATEAATVSQIAANSSFVFFTENGNEQASIMRIAPAGGTPTEVARSELSAVANIVVDDETIFWATSDRIVKLAQ